VTAVVPQPPALDLGVLRSTATALADGWHAAIHPATAADLLHQAADELETLRPIPKPVAPVPIRLCDKHLHMNGAACDRQAGHTGMHSWQIANLARIADDHDAAQAALRQARAQITTLDRRARMAEADRDQLLAERAKRRWRLPIPRRKTD
jgi:hypothetical protein